MTKALSHLAKLSSELVKDIALKHVDGEFLPDITLKNPHLHKRKQALLDSYCDLLIRVGDIFKDSRCKHKTKQELQDWIKARKTYQEIEHNLVFDSCLIDIGENH